MSRTFAILPLVLLAASGPASAGPLVDFSTGPLGALGTYTVEVDGVEVNAIGGELFRWNGDHCCEHTDRGLGILGPGQAVNPAEPELDAGEFLRIRKPWDARWSGVWFTSVNGDASAAVYAGIYAVGPSLVVSALTAGPDGVFYLPITGPAADAYALWVVPRSGYMVAWGVDLERAPEVPATVPEPATLTLLGLGCGAFATWRRRASR